MPTSSEFRRAMAGLSKDLVGVGFHLPGSARLLFVRQRGPLLNIVSIFLSRSRTLAEFKASVWSPVFEGKSLDEEIDLAKIGLLVGGDVSPRGVREAWLWEVGTPDLLEATIPAMQRAVAEVVLPWFASMSSADAVLAECALSLSWWRTVSRERRTQIAASLAELMDLEDGAVPEFNLRKV